MWILSRNHYYKMQDYQEGLNDAEICTDFQGGSIHNFTNTDTITTYTYVRVHNKHCILTLTVESALPETRTLFLSSMPLVSDLWPTRGGGTQQGMNIHHRLRSTYSHNMYTNTHTYINHSHTTEKASSQLPKRLV